MNKTFRGKAADGDVIEIRLATNDGLTGYKIVKLDGISTAPGTLDEEIIIQAFTTKNDEFGNARTASGNVNFDDPTLIGVCYFKDFATNDNAPSDHTIIFDSMTFNQNIYITVVDVRSSNGANYYLELEQVKLSKDEAAVATLKDMRAGPDTNFGS